MCREGKLDTDSSSSSASVATKTTSTSNATLWEIVVDMIFFRPNNVGKLVTKEDGHFYHIHKMIGILVLAHYAYRTYLLLTTGSMQFDESFFTPYCIVLHMVLSGSSFIFKIPDTRIQSAPMIYPEFRLHSIIFAYRSLIVMLLMWAAKRYDVVLPLYLRGAVILLTMVCADMVTSHYKDQGTTMRAMPFPEYLDAHMKERLNTFYSVCQIFATCQVLFSYHLDEVFAVVWPIQVAALLMTCVRKSIITAGAWHYYYSLSLLSNYIVGPIAGYFNPATTPGGLFFPSAVLVTMLRFYGLPSLPFMSQTKDSSKSSRRPAGINKYALWGMVVAGQVYVMAAHNRYTSVVV
jgi:hypothetical protein